MLSVRWDNAPISAHFRIQCQKQSGHESAARGAMRPRVWVTFALETEGAGKAGRALHPRSRVQYVHKNTHTSIQVQRRTSGLPCAMVLRLMASSPRRRIRLVTVIDGLAGLSNPVGLAKTSIDLTPATGARTTRFCRTRQRRSSGASRSLTENRPAISFAPDAAASTASHPNVRDDGRRPSSGMRRRELCR
jgi:hypothetical protein